MPLPWSTFAPPFSPLAFVVLGVVGTGSLVAGALLVAPDPEAVISDVFNYFVAPSVTCQPKHYEKILTSSSPIYGGKVIGSFRAANRAARQDRNPQTGATIQITASKLPKFKAGNALKAAVK